MRPDDSKFATVPVGKLGIIVHPSCAELGKRIDQYIVNWRKEREHEHKENVVFKDYEQDTYIIDATCSRFGTGEAKALISDSVRGVDLYILADVLNYSLKYKVCGHENHMSPDDIYADVKRIIGAASGKPKSITVIMPFLYESRQHKRTHRESLDCAMALEELVNMGVSNIITFDAHDPRVQNAIPLSGLDNFMPTYQFVKALFKHDNTLKIDKDHLMVISPDEGAMSRAVYLANNLGVDMGMFYKRRDYSKVINGRNPIVAHEFLGSSVEGKTVIVVDDMIASGESMLDTAKELKERKAEKVVVCCTFGLFTAGFDKFDEFYQKGYIDSVVTTNLNYRSPDLFTKEWYVEADMSKYIAAIINSLNHDVSIGNSLSPTDKIQKLIRKYNEGLL